MNSTLFLTGFGIYVLFLIWLGWFVSRNQKSGEDFLLGGRGLPLFLVLGTTVATMVGTGSSMGAGGIWLCQRLGGSALWHWRRSRHIAFGSLVCPCS